ncbi:MAG: hypothetical protein WAK55_12010, partial [Xanthobacteraceae bacterium]
DYATVESAACLRAVLRKRISELGIALECLEDISGCQRGYATRVLGEPPQKRAALETFLWLIGALGLELNLRINPARAAKMAPRYVKRRLTRAMSAPSYTPLELGKAHLWRLGGRARQQLPNASELNRRAALTRWARYRQRQATGI